MALDVAGWRHRHVHARKVMMGFFGVTGVILNPAVNVLGQAIRSILATPAGAGIRPYPGGANRILPYYL